MVHFKANKVPYLLDWGHGRPLKFVNHILLPAFSYNASSERSGVIVHKDWHVSQWMIIKMGWGGAQVKASSLSSWNEYASMGALI